MSEWAWGTISDVAVGRGLVGGPFGSKLVSRDYVDSGIPVIRGKNLDRGRFVDLTGAVFVSDQKFKQDLKGNEAIPGDLLFTQRGTLGQVAVLPEGAPRAVVSQSQMRLRVDVSAADPWFVYYWAKSSTFGALLNDRAIVSGVPHINLGILAVMPLPLPPLDEQRRIAAVLCAFDDLIETDRRLVLDHWDAAEGAYERTAQTGHATALGELLTLRYGKALPASRRVPGPYPVVSSAGVTGSHSAPLVPGPGVVVGRKGTVGSVTWVFDDFFPIDTAFYVETDLPMLYAYFALRAAGLSHMNTDSAVPGLNRDNALRRQVALPCEHSVKEFERVTGPLLAAVKALGDEIDDLTRTRDELLPLLMSGRVRAKDAVKVVA